VAIASARSVVVLSDADSDGDACAVKAALAANAMLGDTDVPIVVELGSESTAAALVGACGDRVIPVHATDIIAKVVAQACRQAGLGAVYRELLDFDGDEMYMFPATDVVGRRFGDVLLAYAGCTLLGLQHADGGLSLCPDLALEIAAGDNLLMVAEDDSAISFTGTPTTEAAAANSRPATVAPEANRLLVIGWSDLGGRIVEGLDGMLPPGAQLRIVVDPDVVDPSTVTVTGLNHSVDVIADPGIAALRVGDFDQIFVLGYRGHLSPSEADARTLLTIITLNRALGDVAHRPRVVAEVLESRTVPIAATAGLDDFVVSDDLASLLMAQLSENPRLAGVFGELFGSTGPTITMQPCGRYVGFGELGWGSVVLAVAKTGDLAIGYRNAAAAVVVNPSAAETLSLGEDDQIVVLTRNP
jgi:voltage-gated potassium channel Kch